MHVNIMSNKVTIMTPRHRVLCVMPVMTVKSFVDCMQHLISTDTDTDIDIDIAYFHRTTIIEVVNNRSAV